MTVKEYNQCVDLYADGVYRFILKNIKNEEMARDIVQDAFAKMWEKAKDIAFEKSKSYLFTAAYHTMIDGIRKEKNRINYEAAYDNDVTDEKGYSDLKEILEAAASKLPEIQRSVLMLRDYEGYSYKEIGEITDLNESQVKVYIYRARIFMKNYLVSMDRVI
ncbi:MAG: RNA polymerase sigma factor [Bacteroidales bacterium]|nr:RNA polymerase sigma factor [Bacteroidales bacterium]MCF8403755.1 RNA polymerase sigma factor [Bacteroidales bacterium]